MNYGPFYPPGIIIAIPDTDKFHIILNKLKKSLILRSILKKKKYAVFKQKISKTTGS